MPSAGASGHDLDRELNELLQELRVILPGIQVLFAFLLIVPFSDLFHSAGSTTETAYFVAFAMTALAYVCTIAPGVQHRVRWRRHDKEILLRTANRLTLTATALIAVAIATVVFLITDYLYGPTIGAVCSAGVAALAAILWWGLPIAREHQQGRGSR
jgi:amino acid transporter